jgi:hypothetical protein
VTASIAMHRAGTSLIPVTLEGAYREPAERAWGRLAICLSTAALLHASALLVRVSARPLLLGAPVAQQVADAIPVTLDAQAGGFGSAPGGGSEQPDPRAPARAVPAGPQDRTAKVVRVGPAALPREKPTVGETEEPTPAQPESTTRPDVLSALDGSDTPTFVRPRRTEMMHAERSVPATGDQSNQPPSTSRFVGYGPGANGGPGGPGSGWGHAKDMVSRQFTFGGRSGAFRGEVCFFEEHVRGLGQIKDCRPAATFYTTVLNVPSRRFTEGFPGVSSRIEWFAIRYRGKFTVATSGTYRFRLLSDDGSMLYIDGRLVINNDGQHPPFSREGSLALEAGEHALFVNYYQGPRETIALQLFVTPPNGRERLLGPTL